MKKLFVLDYRSIALFRILIGLSLAADTLAKLSWARSFYTDWGIAPRTYLIANLMNLNKVSLHLASGQLWFQVLLFLIQLGFAIGMIVGFRSRLAALGGFALLFSVQARNPQILSGADEILRLAILWSIFLPLDARFALRRVPTSGTGVASWGTAGAMLQLLLMYFTSVFHKFHPMWVRDFTAIHFALHGDMFASPLGIWLRQFETLTKVMTFGSYALETLGPVFALIGGLPRLLIVVSFIGFHLGLDATIQLGLFPWICIAYWTLLTPALAWETRAGGWLETRLARFEGRLGTTASAPENSRLIRMLGAAVPAALLLLVVWINFSSLDKLKDVVPAPPKFLTDVTATHQKWDMFAPPFRNDGWFVMPGIFSDGTELDLWTREPVTYAKPAVPSDAYPISEWRKYLYNVWDQGSERLLLPFARYLCRVHGGGDGPHGNVQTFKIEFVKEATPDPGQPWAPLETKLLWSHDCTAK